MSIQELFDLYQKLEGQLRELAIITKENVPAHKDAAIPANALATFDEVRGHILQKLTSLRAGLASAQDFLRHYESMTPSERQQYESEAREAQEKVTTLQRDIDKLSLAEGWRVDILRHSARRGLAIVLERAKGVQT